jgi:hypothetical protein
MMADQKKQSGPDLRSIAIYQKAILLCILIYFGLVLGGLAMPQELRFLVGLAILGLGLVSTVLVFLLATKVNSTAIGIVLGILTFIPCIGLIILLYINNQATSTLKEHGIRVGLLGASMSDLN